MVEYRGRDTPGRDSKNQKVTQERATCLLDERTLWPKTLQLKVGAMIMLICVSLLSIPSVVHSLTISEHGSECDRPR